MSCFTVKMLNKGDDYQKRVLYLEGDSYSQGHTHGRLAADLMRINLADLQNQINTRDPAVAEAYDLNAAFVEKHNPDLWAEMQGMAEGSGLPFRDILTLNLPVVTILGLLNRECSQYAKVLRRPDGTTQTLIAKTRDQPHGPLEHVVLLRKYPDGLELAEVTFAGVVTSQGSILTSEGFAIGTSGVWSKRTPFDLGNVSSCEVGVRAHEVARHAGNFENLIAFHQTLDRMTGINYVIAQSGEVAAFEVTNDKAELLERSSESVIRTNHYRSEQFEYLSPTREEYTSTYHRYDRIASLLPGVQSVADMWAIAQDHVGHPQDSICRHSIPGRRSSFTTYASIFDVEARTLYLGLGHPCEVPFS